MYKNKDWLRHQYWEEGFSISRIAGICNTCTATIRRWMKKFNIKRRTISEAIRGKNHPNWKGGKIRMRGEYILIYKPNHPRANCQSYVFKHRLVMEKKLGRYLTKDEIVHHQNGIKDDNSPENLFLETRNTHPKGYAGGYREGYKIAMSKMTERLMENRNN